MDKSDIKTVRMLRSEISGTPLLQITTDDGKSNGFYVNEYDVVKFIDAIGDAYKHKVFHFWLLDLRLYNALRNLEHKIK